MMAKHSAEDQLNVKDQYRIPAQHEQLRVPVIGGRLRDLLYPSATCENCDGDSDTEKSLPHGGMRSRNCGRKKMQHSDAAQYPLRDDRSQSSEGEVLHPAATVHEPRPECNHNRAQAGKPGNHTVAVLVNNSRK